MTARRPSPTAPTSEEETRSLYPRWIDGAVGVIEELIEGADCGVPQSNPTRGHQVEPLDPAFATSTVDPARIQDAVSKGWLVSVPDTRRAPRMSTGRLAGLSVAVKDVIDVAGLPTRNGTPGALWRTPDRSARAWALLANEGAVCVGKAATHEMAWGVTTPQIPHPNNPDLVAGGSSGGSAACVAAGVSAAALGTDTGGSIRIPSALCGVVGLRPTHGSVPLDGATPLAIEQDVIGPMARDVDTCSAVFEVMSGRQLSAFSLEPAGMRIGVLERVGRLDPEVERGYRRSLARLEGMGVRLIPCATDLHRSARSVSLLTMLASSAREHAQTVRADPDGFGAPARALLTLGESLKDRTEDLKAARRILRAHTDTLFATHRLDAFITPTCPCLAPNRHSRTVRVGSAEQPVDAALVAYTAWASAAGLPAVTVPVASGSLPIGVQVMAGAYREDVCLRVAHEIK